jgi:hypothetical protein
MRCVSGAFRPVLGRLTTVRVDIQAGAIARMSFASIESLCRVIVSDAGRIDRQRRAHPFVLADVRSCWPMLSGVEIALAAQKASVGLDEDRSKV